MARHEERPALEELLPELRVALRDAGALDTLLGRHPWLVAARFAKVLVFWGLGVEYLRKAPGEAAADCAWSTLLFFVAVGGNFEGRAALVSALLRRGADAHHNKDE